MAGSLKTQIAQVAATTWTKVMGQGIRSLTATDEFTAAVTIQNRSGGDATAYLGVVHGDSAPASLTAPGVFEIELADNEIVTRDRLGGEAGVTVWVYGTAQLEVIAAAHFAATA